mmetsp:Transcript_19942/g.63142  ORF Transcript_19942/g.63142 Transcript_19942/m.63142 type:complete len:129 (+) Transcript_19942:167-553(+)
MVCTSAEWIASSFGASAEATTSLSPPAPSNDPFDGMGIAFWDDLPGPADARLRALENQTRHTMRKSPRTTRGHSFLPTWTSSSRMRGTSAQHPRPPTPKTRATRPRGMQAAPRTVMTRVGLRCDASQP